MGQDSVVDIATRYRLDGPGIESRCEVRFSAPDQTVCGAHPASYKMGTVSVPVGRGGKWLGRGVDHPPPSSTEVKERLELYICSPSGSSWPVLRWTLPFVAYRCASRCLFLIDTITFLSLVSVLLDFCAVFTLYHVIYFFVGLEHGSPTFLWHRATSVAVGWFAGRTWKNNNDQAKLSWNFYNIHIIYKCGRGPHNILTGLELETHGLKEWVFYSQVFPCP